MPTMGTRLLSQSKPTYDQRAYRLMHRNDDHARSVGHQRPKPRNQKSRR